MPMFRKKPVEIEAFRLGVQNPPQWFEDAMRHGNAWYRGGDEPYYAIKTLEGEMRARTGDWIIRGVKGEIYPCRDDIFHMTYEPAE